MVVNYEAILAYVSCSELCNSLVFIALKNLGQMLVFFHNIQLNHRTLADASCKPVCFVCVASATLCNTCSIRKLLPRDEVLQHFVSVTVFSVFNYYYDYLIFSDYHSGDILGKLNAYLLERFFY